MVAYSMLLKNYNSAVRDETNLLRVALQQNNLTEQPPHHKLLLQPNPTAMPLIIEQGFNIT
jgi:hypothetical protein